jgi:ribosomal protein L20A (L18A)
MKFFEVKGEFSERGKKKKFTKKVKAESHKFAAEKIMCLMGSKHRIKRRHIALSEVKEMGEKNGGEKSG